MRAPFHARDGQKILQQEGEATDIPVDRFQGFFSHGGIFQSAFAESFHIAVDDGQRRAEFMRDIRDELPPHGLQSANGCDFLKNDQSRPGSGFFFSGERGDMDEECSRIESNLKIPRPPRGHGGFHGLLDFMAAQHLQHCSVHRVFDVWKKLHQRLVANRHALGAVHDEDSLAHAGKNAPQAEALVGNLAVELLELTRDFPDVRRRFEIRGVVGGEGRKVVVAAGHSFQVPANGAPGFNNS